MIKTVYKQQRSVCFRIVRMDPRSSNVNDSKPQAAPTLHELGAMMDRIMQGHDRLYVEQHQEYMKEVDRLNQLLYLTQKQNTSLHMSLNSLNSNYASVKEVNSCLISLLQKYRQTSKFDDMMEEQLQNLSQNLPTKIEELVETVESQDVEPQTPKASVVQREIAVQTEQEDDLQSAIMQKDREIEELKDCIRLMDEEYVRATAFISKSQLDLNSKDQQIEILMDEKDSLRALLEEKKHSDDVMAELEWLRDSESRLQSSVGALTNSLEEVKAKHLASESNVEMLKAELLAKDEQLAVLSKQVNDYASMNFPKQSSKPKKARAGEVKEDNVEVMMLQNQIAQLEENLKSQKKISDDFCLKAGNMSVENNKKLKEIQAETEKFKKDLESKYAMDKADMQKTIATLRSGNEKLLQKIQVLNMTPDNVQQKLLELQESHSKLTSRYKELKTMLGAGLQDGFLRNLAGLGCMDPHGSDDDVMRCGDMLH